jgi:hypothetical protein
MVVGVLRPDHPVRGPGEAVPTSRPLTPEERADRYRPGPPWDGKGRAGKQPNFRTQAEMEAFADFPLFWLGPEFGGYNLTIIEHVKSEQPSRPGLDALNQVGFLYGECNLRGQDSCPIPITFLVESACASLPAESLAGGQALSSETVRGGAQLVRYAHTGVRLWTGRSSIVLHAIAAPERTDEAIQAIRGFGLNRAIGPGDPLPPPDLTGCRAPLLPPTPRASPSPPP